MHSLFLFLYDIREGKESSFLEASTDDDYVSKTFMPLYETLKEKAVTIKTELEKGNKEINNIENLKEFEKLTNEEKILRIKIENDLMLAKFNGQDFLENNYNNDDDHDENKKAIEKMKLECDIMYAKMTGQGLSEIIEDDEEDKIMIAKMKKESDEMYSRLSGQSIEDLEKSDEEDRIAVAKIYAENREKYREEYEHNDMEEAMIKQEYIDKQKNNDSNNDVDDDNEDDDDDDERKNTNIAEAERLKETKELRKMKIDSALWYKKYFGGNIPEDVQILMKEEEEEGKEDKEKNVLNKTKIIHSLDSNDVGKIDRKEETAEKKEREDKRNHLRKLREDEVERLELEQIEIDSALGYQQYMGGKIPDKIKDLIEKRRIEKEAKEKEKE